MPPLRWYLAQGLIPLTEDSSDDDEGPYQLADGRLVCGLHGLVVCGKCCVDYSFMDDNHVRDEDELPELDNDHVYFPQDSDYEDMYGRRTRRGTGQVFPTKFVPPNDSVKPTELFTLEKRFNGFDNRRYTLQDDRGTVLVHTDGACLNNGQPNPKAGWAFSLGSVRRAIPSCTLDVWSRRVLLDRMAPRPAIERSSAPSLPPYAPVTGRRKECTRLSLRLIPSMLLRARPDGSRNGSRMTGRSISMNGGAADADGRTSKTGICGRLFWEKWKDVMTRT